MSEPLEEVEQTEEEVSLPEAIQKTKKPRTQKQIEAFEKVRKIRDEKRLERKEVKVKADTVYKQEKEAKIVKKALSIKKKQILADADLDDVSDDEIPAEIVKKIMTKYVKKPVARTRVIAQEEIRYPTPPPQLVFI